MEKLVSMVSRIFFLGAFVLFVLALIEKIANAIGYTVLRLYRGGRVLEFAVVLLVFVIALQLKEIKDELQGQKALK
jgi:hypothetical protein